MSFLQLQTAQATTALFRWEHFDSQALVFGKSRGFVTDNDASILMEIILWIAVFKNLSHDTEQECSKTAMCD